MKKSKILGIGLGCAALTAVAIATPVIATSCSNDEVKPNYTIKNTFVKTYGGHAEVTALTGGNSENVVIDENNNEITVYTGQSDKQTKAMENNTFIGLELSTTLSEIFKDNKFLEEKGFDCSKTTGDDAVTLTWQSTFTTGDWKKGTGDNTVVSTKAITNETKLSLELTISQKLANEQEAKTEKVTFNISFKLGNKQA